MYGDKNQLFGRNKGKTIKMRLAGVPIKEVLSQLNSPHYTQLKKSMTRHKNRETHRLEQLYLSSIQDLFNREIIAYSIGDCQDVAFVLDKLSQHPFLNEGCTLL